MKKQLFVILLLTILGIESVSAGKIIYVKSNGGNNNNGSSWSNATSLQNALTKAVSGDDIWVAEGEYKPGSTRDASFVLKLGVKMYGGFKGTETGNDYTKREGEFEKTILSGEIGNLDVISDNVYHVVVLKGDNTIDGFTITGGYADETESKINQIGNGAGIFAETSKPVVIKNNIIQGNTNRFELIYGSDASILGGAGVFVLTSGGATVNLINNTINNNHIKGFHNPTAFGGGAYIYASGAVTIKDNQIFENSVDTNTSGFFVIIKGGGLYVFGEKAIEVVNNIVEKNVAQTGNAEPNNIEGGGICVVTNEIVKIKNNQIRENAIKIDTPSGLDTFGGGCFVSGKEQIEITDNIIEKNIIDGYGTYGDTYASGGGIYVNEAKKIEINNNIIRENEAKASSYKAPSMSSGGGVYISGKSVLNIKNNLIEKNKLITSNYYQPDSVLGGGIYVSNDEKTIYLVNNTIVKNEINESASEKIGTGICIKGKSIISNSILWDNKGGKEVIEKDPSGAIEPTIQYSLVQGRKDTNNGNIDASKIVIQNVFVDYQNNNYSLKENSPLIDKGNNVSYTDAGGNLSVDKDLAGYRRLSGSIIDMGAYEYQKEPVSNIDVVGVESVKVYPTLTKGTVYIETTGGILPTVSVYTVNGKLLQTIKANEINLSVYPKGIYILQIGTRIEKVIKQ